MLLKKLAEDFEDTLISRIEAMDRQQWSRSIALAYFSAPVRNCLGDDPESERDNKGPEHRPNNSPVLYLFFYQKNRVWTYLVEQAALSN